MKLSEIPEKTNLELHLSYKEKHVSIMVQIQIKAAEYIFIQVVNSNGTPIDKLSSYNPSIVYKTDNGIFIFSSLKIQLVLHQGSYFYAVSCPFEVEKENRREAYRVFVSNPYTVKIIKRDGKVTELHGLLKDVSLTGMGVILKYRADDFLLMEVTVDYGKNMKLTLGGEVMRITELPNQKGFLYGCRFYKAKEELNRYLLKLQMKNKVRN